jgi:hypothetical protein
MLIAQDKTPKSKLHGDRLKFKGKTQKREKPAATA